ncbi:HD-GYP domain-containing protein [Bacillus sp. RG28]|uniref:HD-GYP domain-containing protein n=1 Tax=Gottfriedia endophytica TaxID=2820819 RepID=A0A940NPZ9_9BACI|nr:HD-GYP domain-containing protein [Gottfriedia endophytica]MBP0725625.1 HD-GYP domain-containing protein [Gottfriedia endophytica]
MRIVVTSTLVPGTKLGKPIYNEQGKILVNANVPLTEMMINRLHILGISFVYIQDPLTEDIQIEKTISDELRIESTKKIEDTFLKFQNEESHLRWLSLEKSTSQLKGIISSLLKELKENKDMLSLLADVICYDEYIFSHSLNVTMYALSIGINLGFSQKQLDLLGLGALLHDVGKMVVPLSILEKPGRLTDDEYEQIKLHTTAGYEILRTVPNIHSVAAICALQHHERLNGSGYPHGISGKEMHQYSKIIAIADVFDAVTSNRVYRQAMLPHEGLELLYSGSDKLFDSSLIQTFRESLSIYPTGLTVKLNDGRQGVVCRQNRMSSDRPVVRILEENGGSVSIPYELDLYDNLNFVIVECDTTFKHRVAQF